MREKVLGLPVDILTKKQTLEKIEYWIKLGGITPKVLVTAYSEFYVNALRDPEFARILSGADMVTADGRSVLAAVEYNRKTQSLKNSKNQNIVSLFWEGLKVGRRILKNDLGETVTGVWLFESLTFMAEKKGWKVFLLGGERNSSARAARILLKQFPDLKLSYDEGEKRLGESRVENDRIVGKINKFKPDILFVTYSAVGQYKWIWENKANLRATVALGIGGTLDEFVGDLKQAPNWMQKVGLKWLWRLFIQPKRWRRIIDAVIVFPWLVFRESLKK